MSTTKIQLPDFLIAELFKSSLVDLPILGAEASETKADELLKIDTVKEKVPIEIEHLGGNKKNVIIVVKQSEAPFLLKEDFSFLTNILKACLLTLDDIAIINISKQEINFKAIRSQLKAEYLFMFDIDASFLDLPCTIPFEKKAYNGCTIMSAPSLSNLNAQTPEGKILRTKLWLSLKEIFNII